MNGKPQAMRTWPLISTRPFPGPDEDNSHSRRYDSLGHHRISGLSRPVGLRGREPLAFCAITRRAKSIKFTMWPSCRFGISGSSCEAQRATIGSFVKNSVAQAIYDFNVDLAVPSWFSPWDNPQCCFVTNQDVIKLVRWTARDLPLRSINVYEYRQLRARPILVKNCSNGGSYDPQQEAAYQTKRQVTHTSPAIKSRISVLPSWPASIVQPISSVGALFFHFFITRDPWKSTFKEALKES
jgi:hypothetical protein